MDEMEIIPGGIINKFCGKIPKIENKNPLNPNSFTIKPTVKPMAKPLNIITMGIIPIPIIINPVPKTNPMVLKLSIIDCFNMDIPSNSLPSIALKKRIKKD